MPHVVTSVTSQVDSGDSAGVSSKYGSDDMPRELDATQSGSAAQQRARRNQMQPPQQQQPQHMQQRQQAQMQQQAGPAQSFQGQPSDWSRSESCGSGAGSPNGCSGASGYWFTPVNQMSCDMMNYQNMTQNALGVSMSPMGSHMGLILCGGNDMRGVAMSGQQYSNPYPQQSQAGMQQAVFPS